MASIEHAISARVNATLPLPDKHHPRKWIRFPCPFCGKDRAAINYRLDLFICYHADCRERIWARPVTADDYLVRRFVLQVEQAVRNTRGKWGGWIDEHDAKDLEQFAWESVIQYDGNGQLDDWEAKLNGDPDQLDRFVLTALNRDLADWARALNRAKKRTLVTDPEDISRTEATQRAEMPDDVIMWVDWPTLEMRFRYLYTVKEISKLRGVSMRTTNRRYAEELADAEKTYREQGYGSD